MEDVPLRNFQTSEQTVFKTDSGGIYRIPALLYERQSETLLAFAEQRATEKDESTKNLVMKTGKLKKEESSDVRTIEWSEMKTVKEAHIDDYRPMNPCPVYERNSKTLFLFFICVEDSYSEAYQRKHFKNMACLCYITSENLGQNWSNLTDLTDTLPEIKNWATFAVGPGHGIQTDSRTLIVPTYAYVISCSSCCFFSTCKKTAPYALPLCGEDSGKKWKFGKVLQNESVECEMAELFHDKCNKKGFIYCNARTEGGYRVEAHDTGGGFITLPSAEMLVETGTGCQGSVVSFPPQSDDEHVGQPPNMCPKWLLYTHPTDKAKRINLGVYLNKSPQDPDAWSKPWIINSGPSGYSDLAYIDNGWFACLIECGEKTEIEQIACVVFSYNDVKQGTGV